MNNLQHYKNKLERFKGQKDQIKSDIKSTKQQIKSINRSLLNNEEAQLIIQIVAQQTQEKLEFRISEIVTLALASVFDDPYTFKIKFNIKRGKTECETLFLRNDSERNPLESSGWGAVDIASFGLRVACWTLQKPRKRNVLVLDEPFRHLKGIEANRKAIQMVKEISDKLNLQIIMINDERVPLNEIEKGADKIFNISIKKGKTKIEWA